MPLPLTAVNGALLEWIIDSRGQRLAAYGLIGWYVLQLALSGWIVGRWLQSPIFRWLVLGWNILSIYFQSAALAIEADAGQLLVQAAPEALLAGVMGWAVIWGVLGDGRWPIRWAAMVALVAILPSLRFLFKPLVDWWNSWTQLTLLQTAVLVLICSVLRLHGWRLATDGAIERKATADRLTGLQLGIRDFLVWTAVVGLLLGLSHAREQLNFVVEDLFRTAFYWKLSAAMIGAIGIIVALWMVLGQGHWLVRFAVGLAFLTVAGSGFGAVTAARFDSVESQNAAEGWIGLDWEAREFFQLGWWWVGWLLLSSGIFAATLIIFRTRGYRLRRVPWRAFVSGGRRAAVAK
ncbi:MAG TPA: hypothetical protein VMP01_28380 [Pirellulaceae bacterium]|nr:hypothetical protein [Pirellulaceae bacterium]